MRLLIAVLVILLIGLQYMLWLGEGGYREVRRLERVLAGQQAENAALLARNRALQAEVEDLKQGLEAIEERAREDLGMIREGETFFQVVPGAPPGRAQRQTGDSDDE